MSKSDSHATAQYDFSLRTAPGGGVIAVIDQGNDSPVTNDANAVVADVADRLLGGLGARPMIYRDTSGRYDGLDHDGQSFVGFYPIGVLDESEAIIHVDLGGLI